MQVHFNALALIWKVDAFSRNIYAWKQTKFCCSSPLLIKNWIFYCLIFYFPFSDHIIHQLYPDNTPKINWGHQVGASRVGAPLEAEAEELQLYQAQHKLPSPQRWGHQKGGIWPCPKPQQKATVEPAVGVMFLVSGLWIFSCVTCFSGTCCSLMPWRKQEKSKALTLAKLSTLKWGSARIKVSFMNRVHEYKHDAHLSVRTYAHLYIFIYIYTQ